jgi:hypothetical protein
VNTTPPLRPGEWRVVRRDQRREPNGLDWWLLDVQAHGTFVAQPGPGTPWRNPPPSTGSGEDGQLIAIKISNSQ